MTFYETDIGQVYLCGVLLLGMVGLVIVLLMK